METVMTAAVRSAVACLALGAVGLAAHGAERGFYRVEQTENGRWWTLDPDGKRTIIRGVDWVI